MGNNGPVTFTGADYDSDKNQIFYFQNDSSLQTSKLSVCSGTCLQFQHWGSRYLSSRVLGQLGLPNVSLKRKGEGAEGEGDRDKERQRGTERWKEKKNRKEKKLDGLMETDVGKLPLKTKFSFVLSKVVDTIYTLSSLPLTKPENRLAFSHHF